MKKIADLVGRLIRITPRLIKGDKTTWRRLRLELASRTAQIWGNFPVYDDYKMWRQDDDFMKDFAKLSPGNRFSDERKYTLREFARQVSKLEGAIAECGSFEGASAYFLAKESPTATIHLFDSFEGLSEPTKNDIWSLYRESYWKKGDMKASLTILKDNLKEFDNVKVHKGWIPHIFEDCSEKKFKLLHIDVDLYQPTIDSLEYFYPQIVAGGVVILDDYGYLTCPGAHRAANEFADRNHTRVLHLTTGQGVIFKQ